MGIGIDHSLDAASPQIDLATAIAGDWDAAYAALEWQLECGIDTAFSEDPLDRYAIAEQEAGLRRNPRPNVASTPAKATEAAPPPEFDAVAEAQAAAAAVVTLDALKAALEGFAHCDLKRGARHTVFADGNPAARVMVIGEAPGREEDLEGRPFVGVEGQLLDKMFAAIGLSRRDPDAEKSIYISNILPWRPEGGRDPSPEEIAMMRPFVERHITLADPDVVVLLGNTPLLALTGQTGINKMRGQWGKVLGKPALPMFHPAALLRNPIQKREAWADLLALQAYLRG